MEDFYETRIDGVDGELVGLFGVFDGECLKFLIFSYRVLRIENMNYVKYIAKYRTWRCSRRRIRQTEPLQQSHQTSKIHN